MTASHHALSLAPPNTDRAGERILQPHTHTQRSYTPPPLFFAQVYLYRDNLIIRARGQSFILACFATSAFTLVCCFVFGIVLAIYCCKDKVLSTVNGCILAINFMW